MKKVKRLLKKAGNYYVHGLLRMYAPALEHGINPFI